MAEVGDTSGNGRERESVGSPFDDFATAAREVLSVLRDRLKLRLWMVTRAIGGDEIVLEVDDSLLSGSPVLPGVVLSWDGSLCREMVAGNGPSIAPRVADIPAYASSANRRLFGIEAYVGVPLREPDGTLFGTLCGFDPDPQPESLRDDERLLEVMGRLLATVLAFELDREHQRRRAERAEAAATRDGLTDLANRRGWDDVVFAEEARCRRYGHPGVVVVIDLNDLKAVNDTRGHAAGDQLLRDCAKVLAATARESDFVARLGGDEFAVLAVETDRSGGEVQAARIRRALEEAGIGAAIGLGVRSSDGSLVTAAEAADRAMYVDKRAVAQTAGLESRPASGMVPGQAD